MNADWRAAYRRVHQSANYRLRFLAGGRWAAHCRPTSIIFMLTARCNARCVHCDIWKNRGPEAGATAEEWKVVFSDLRKWLGPVQVVFSGGEALLKPYTAELAAHASGLGLYLEVLTHGYWADADRVRALARSGAALITVSLDGIGETHSRIRGREDFWEKTHATLQLLRAMRREERLRYRIRLKTVIMRHNLDDLAAVAEFAQANDMEVFYQPIEQNYNTPEDPAWFEHSPNWPVSGGAAAVRIEELIRLKRAGLPVTNSYAQLRVMIAYFQDPAALHVAVQAHAAHERKLACDALTTLEFRANGDVHVCAHAEPVGNICAAPVRRIWETRPHWWEEGCCLLKRVPANAEHA